MISVIFSGIHINSMCMPIKLPDLESYETVRKNVRFSYHRKLHIMNHKISTANFHKPRNEFNLKEMIYYKGSLSLSL